MTEAQRFEAMQRELGFLRAEMDLNRKYIFERPLLIVAGGVTAAATLKELVGFEVLPLLLIVLMGYNLWFTYNRLQSNARIISYLQVVYTPAGFGRWVGWEAALLSFRKHGSRSLRSRTHLGWEPSDEQQGNRFYGPILSFHVAAVVLLTGFLLAQSELVAQPFHVVGPLQASTLGLTLLALVAFLVLSWFLRPGKVRFTIDESRNVWQKVLLSMEARQPPNQSTAVDRASAASE
jgi:hypothetical protein